MKTLIPVYELVMTTLIKRPNVFFEAESIIKLIAVSTVVFGRKNQIKLNLDLLTVQKLHSIQLKPKPSSRWYKNYRIASCDTDEDIMKVFIWTKHLSRGKFLLPDSIDCTDMLKHTQAQMPRFFKVLGDHQFCQHMKNVFNLVNSLRSEIYDQFCELCQQKDGLNIEKLCAGDAKLLLAGFSKNLYENQFEY